ncbi:bZIP transcription factor 49 [Cladorrhinum sp. PSN332]|nr:bZIP transcription factor 49 [Cladorrhinum sp. PSN332]
MVSQFTMRPSFFGAPLSVDTSNTKYFDEDDSILDDNILDQSALDSGLEMSPPMVDSRRESFGVAPSLFSPKAEDWRSVEMPAVASNNPFFDPHSNNPFLRMDQGQQAVYQSQSWPMTSSGSATPQLQAFDGLPVDYDTGMSLFPRPAPIAPQPTPFTNPANQVAMFQPLGQAPAPQSMPTSPQKDLWMSQDLKNQALKRPQPASPMIRSHNEMRRGDGIRKKNARFEIPAERNLNNIDQLIAQSTDEQEIRELKQQKRLLRNRQAALDSRQRKKLHTERLEDEKKHFAEMLSGMEDTVGDLQMQIEKLTMEKHECENYIHNLEREREEMISKHTIETGELRKKISVLTNHVQALEGVNNGYGQMDIPMSNSWGNMPNMFGEYPMEQSVDVKQEMDMQIVPTAKKSEVVLSTDCEKPAQQGGLLFMLFLVGAFVLSNRSTPNIPRVSEDVRAASASILENVFKDAGVNQVPSALAAMAPRPSGASWAQAPSASSSSLSMSAQMVDNVAPSMLGDMADVLTQPTEQQTNEQLFSLSAAQYNDLTSQDFPPNAQAERTMSEGRRNLANALGKMRESSKESTAEVYTRSLLWDQIPGDVVRTFARMVQESNNAQQVAAGGDNDHQS